MHYTFIDIGCGNTNVSVDEFGLNVMGLLVEPIQEFCNILPTSNTVQTVCTAITDYDGEAEMNLHDIEMTDIHYIPIIALNNMTRALRMAKNFKIFGGESLMKQQNHSRTRNVTCMRLETLLKKFDIDSVNQLKIDVEGFENIILQQLIELMRQDKFKVNNRIIFEYNHLSNLEELDALTKIIADEFSFTYEFRKLGWNEDIIMTKVGL